MGAIQTLDWVGNGNFVRHLRSGELIQIHIGSEHDNVSFKTDFPIPHLIGIVLFCWILSGIFHPARSKSGTRHSCEPEELRGSCPPQ